MKDTKNLVFLYRAGEGIPGVNADVDPSALSPNEFQTLNNLRASRGGMRARGGIDAKNATGIASGTYRGSLTGFTNGTFRQLLAQDTGVSTRLYYSPDTAFSEFSGVAGKYSATRLATGSDVVFSIVKDATNSAIAPFAGKSGRDLVVASDGSTTVVWDPIDNECAVHEKVTAPSFGLASQTASFPDYINLAASNVTPVASDADTTVTDNSTYATYGTTPKISWAITATAGDYGELQFAVGDTLASGTQFKILYNSGDTEIWKKVKIELYDGSLRTLYDPATDEEPLVIEANDTKLIDMAVFRIDPDTVPNNTHTRIRFTWTGASPTVATDLYVFGLYGGGLMPGGTSLTLSRFNEASRAESQGTTCADKYGDHARFLGLQDRLNDTEIPISESVLYSYKVTSDQVTATELAKGVNYLLVYALFPTTQASVHVQSEVFGTYAAGWTAARPDNKKFTFTVNSETFSVRQAPDRLSRPCMPHKCSAFSGSRLFIGSVKSSDGAGQNTDVYFSEREMPFRFRESVSFIEAGVPDPLSAGRTTIPGEQPKAIVVLASNNTGSEPVLVFTEQSMWGLNGPDSYNLSRATRLSPHGAAASRCVAVYMDAVYWLDQDKQLRKYPGSVEPLSRDRFSSPLNAIPDAYIGNASAFVYQNFLYFPYTIGGGAQNTAVGVYDIIHDKFYRDVSNLSGITFASFFAKGDQLRFWTQTGQLYEHDSSQTDDAGTAIPINITTREVAENLWSHSEYGDVGVLCEDMNSKTWTFQWNGRQTGTTDSATASVDVSSGMAYKWAQSTLSTAFGLSDVSASLQITGGVVGNKKILAIVARIRPLNTQAN